MLCKAVATVRFAAALQRLKIYIVWGVHKRRNSIAFAFIRRSIAATYLVISAYE